jgi:putative FmdB family regulatory protein
LPYFTLDFVGFVDIIVPGVVILKPRSRRGCRTSLIRPRVGRPAGSFVHGFAGAHNDIHTVNDVNEDGSFQHLAPVYATSGAAAKETGTAMPLYEYRCKSCRRQFDLLRPMELSNKNADCPSCGKPSPRILSVFAATTRDASGNSEPVSGTSNGGCGSGSCCGGSCASMN